MSLSNEVSQIYKLNFTLNRTVGNSIITKNTSKQKNGRLQSQFYPFFFNLSKQNLSQEMEQVFLKIDTDNSGNLSLEEVVLFLKSITDDISEDNIEKIFEGIDTSGDKVVDLEEFKVKFYYTRTCQF